MKTLNFIVLALLFMITETSYSQTNFQPAPEGYDKVQQNIPTGRTDTVSYP